MAIKNLLLLFLQGTFNYNLVNISSPPPPLELFVGPNVGGAIRFFLRRRLCVCVLGDSRVYSCALSPLASLLTRAGVWLLHSREKSLKGESNFLIYFEQLIGILTSIS